MQITTIAINMKEVAQNTLVWLEDGCDDLFERHIAGDKHYYQDRKDEDIYRFHCDVCDDLIYIGTFEEDNAFYHAFKIPGENRVLLANNDGVYDDYGSRVYMVRQVPEEGDYVFNGKTYGVVGKNPFELLHPISCYLGVTWQTSGDESESPEEYRRFRFAYMPLRLATEEERAAIDRLKDKGFNYIEPRTPHTVWPKYINLYKDVTDGGAMFLTHAHDDWSATYRYPRQFGDWSLEATVQPDGSIKYAAKNPNGQLMDFTPNVYELTADEFKARFQSDRAKLLPHETEN